MVAPEGVGLLGLRGSQETRRGSTNPLVGPPATQSRQAVLPAKEFAQYPFGSTRTGQLDMLAEAEGFARVVVGAGPT